MKEYIGQKVEVDINKPIGTKNTEHGFVYPVNYGYITDELNGSSEKVEVYVLGVYEPIESYKGEVIGVIHTKNTDKYRLVVAEKQNSFDIKDIEALTKFQERLSDAEIIAFDYIQSVTRNTTRGLIRRGNEIFVLEEGHGKDEGKEDDIYYHLPGGGIEFYEKSDDAMRREMREELETEVESMEHKMTVENFFSIRGMKCHEICKIYDLKMPEEFYDIEEYNVKADLVPCVGKWVDVEEFKSGRRTFYPMELIELI